MKTTSARIDNKTSRTAQYTCVTRAISFAEKREAYHGPDHIAYRLIPGVIRLLLFLPGFVRLFARFIAPRGIYEYVIARTAFIDRQFQAALQDGARQVVIFGAGFDSRALRFQDLSSGAKIFELDAPVTQEKKRKALAAKGLPSPDNLVFVPLDLNRRSLADSLAQSGYLPGLKSLFILEGLLMYLEPEAVDAAFRLIGQTAGPGSRVVFDFVRAGVVDQAEHFHGGRDIVKTVNRSGEPWTFFLKRDAVGRFLTRYGLSLLELADSRDLERRYFSRRPDRNPIRVNATHCLAAAQKIEPAEPHPRPTPGHITEKSWTPSPVTGNLKAETPA